MSGSQMKFDTPTHRVTSSASLCDRWSMFLPNVGVYAVMV